MFTAERKKEKKKRSFANKTSGDKVKIELIILININNSFLI
jgi:hypothetical protein